MKAITALRLALFLFLSSQIAVAQPGGFYDGRAQAHLTAPLQKTASALVVAEWQLDSMHCESFNGQGWDADTRYYYRYDAQHRRTQDSTITFDHAQQIWQPSTLTFYEYLSGDQVKNVYDLSWKGQAWGQDTMRTRNVYANGLLTEIYEETHIGQGTWASNGKTTLEYDNAGHVAQRFTYFLDESTNLWTVIGRSTPVYLGDLIKEEVFEFTNDNGQTWEKFSRFLYTIQNGRVEGLAIQIWNGADWGHFFREEYTFDDRGLVVHEDSYQFNNGWTPTERCDLFYSEQTTATHDPASAATRLQMANPFSGGQVTAPELPASQEYRVTVFDLAGRPVYDVVASGNRWQLPAPQTAGMHVLTVRRGDEVVAQRKFMVVR